MKKFIIKTLRFLIPPLVILGIGLFIYVHTIGIENLPALNFSSSYSYNEKIRFLKNNSITPEVIAVGSSMTLNNLSSEVVTKEFQNNNYLNVSSWGVKTSEGYKLLKSLYDLNEFKQVISVVNIGDFTKASKKIDYNFIHHYLTNDDLKTTYSIARNFDLHYYLKNIDYANYVRNCNKDYDYLNYDDYGMVKFSTHGFNIKDERWKNNRLDKVPDIAEYSYLDSIANFCTKNNIEYYVFHSPHRMGLIQELNTQENEKFDSHLKKIDRIVSPKHYFVNANDTTWHDALFVDGIHFNETGAKLFTQYCFDRVKYAQQKP
ncbi:MAG: hypothetical protein HKO56_08255 [Bacteroidia bacterium]|nr:hypothetical protein [Bacteroidia bacterium]NNM16635.1 hypothetical protein [Bacteroidia bacterium]